MTDSPPSPAPLARRVVRGAAFLGVSQYAAMGIGFLKMFVLRQGFRDGYHGAVLCMLGAFSVFMKYAKLWHLTQEAKRG